MKDIRTPTYTSKRLTGTLTADGTEQTVGEVLFSPNVGQFRGGWIDPSAMQAGDSITVRIYNRVEDGGDLVLEYTGSQYTGATEYLIALPSSHNRYGVRVTLEQTAGTNRSYPYELFYSEGGRVA